MWIKNLRQRKLQTVMIFLITAICTTLLSGAISILTSLDKPSREFAVNTNAPAAKIYPYYTDEKAIYEMGRQFSGLDSVKNVENAVSHYVDESILLNGQKVEAFVNITEYNDKIFGSAYYLEGSKEIGSTLKDNECILPACLSTEYGVHIGDTVTIQFTKGDTSYRVAAVYSNPFQTSTAFDSDILIKKLPDVSRRISFSIYGKGGASGKQIEEEYREKYDGKLNGYIYILEDRINNGLTVGRIIGALFLAVGAIMLLVSGLMIHYMIKNVIISDTVSIATYKTIGYSSNDILLNYLKLYFTVITAACLAGIFGSVFVSNTVLTSIFENMGQLKASNTFLSGVICYLVTVSFVIGIITILIMKTKRIKPVHALNGESYGGVKKKKHYKGNCAMQFSALGIALRTFIREKKNAVGIIITCIVTIFSVNFMIISLDVAGSMKEDNDVWIGVDKSDVMINAASSKDYDYIKKIVETDERVNYFLGSNLQKKITLDWNKGMTITNLDAFVYDDFTEAKLPVTEGSNPGSGNEIAITTKAAKSLHKSVGDYIEINLDDNTKADMLITGLFQSYMQYGSICRLTASAYTDHGLDITYNNISVYLKEGYDTDNYIQDMKNKISGRGNVIRRTEQFGSIMDMIVKPQLNAIPPVAALTFLIAGLNIFCIIYLKNLKSQRINGIYKCIGYTTWHLIFSNLYYVVAIAAVSVIITLPISVLAYSPIMKLSLSMFNFMKYPMVINITHLLFANAAVIIVFIISTLASSKALFRINARDLTRE